MFCSSRWNSKVGLDWSRLSVRKTAWRLHSCRVTPYERVSQGFESLESTHLPDTLRGTPVIYYLQLPFPCLGFQHGISFRRQHDIRQFLLTSLAWNDCLHNPSRLHQCPETFYPLFLEWVPEMYVKNENRLLSRIVLIVIIRKQKLVVHAIAMELILSTSNVLC